MYIGKYEFKDQETAEAKIKALGVETSLRKVKYDILYNN